jgi:hypothetical protein
LLSLIAQWAHAAGAIQQGLRSGRATSTPDETDSRPGGEDPGAGPGWSQ